MAFIPRTSKTVPTDMTYTSELTDYNKWWYSSTYNGGANARLCLPNCTTYAKGRSCEIAGKLVCPVTTSKTGFTNARLWYQYANTNDAFSTGENWVKSDTPKVGAIVVTDTADPTICGHVAVIESTDGTFDNTYVSYSGYVQGTGTRSFTNPGTSSSYYFRYESLPAMFARYKAIGSAYELTLLGYLVNPFAESSIEPVERDTSVNQLQVNVTQLNIRTGHATTFPAIGKAVQYGYYNVLDSYTDADYTWYQIEENAWLANTADWVTYLPKESNSTLTITNAYATLGTVTGAGNYTTGTTVTVEFTPTDIGEFQYWSTDEDTGEVLSRETSYSFKLNKNTTLVAHVVAKTATRNILVNQIHIPEEVDVLSVRPGRQTATRVGYAKAGGYYNCYNVIESGTVKWYCINNTYQDGDGLWVIDYTNDTETWVEYLPATVYHTITVLSNDETKGTVSGGGTFEEGDPFTISASIISGNKFKHWVYTGTENIYSTSSTVTGIVTENLNLTAIFEEASTDTFTVTTICSPSDGGVISGGGSYQYGETATLSVTVDERYEFIGWYIQDSLAVDGADSLSYNGTDELSGYWLLSTDTTCYYTIYNDVEVTATFKLLPTYDVTTSVSNDRLSITATKTYVRGKTATVEATASSRVRFTNFTVNDTTVTENPYSFTVLQPTTVIANGINLFTVSTAKDGEGTIYDISGTYDEGTQLLLEAEPAEGNKWVGWINNKNGTTYSEYKNLSITLAEDLDLTAKFIETIKYNIALSHDEGVTVSGPSSVEAGETCTVTATVTDVAKTFSGWYINDTLVSQSTTYTFTPTGDTSLTAKVIDKKVSVTANPNDSSKGYTSGSGVYTYGTSVTVSANTLSPLYEFKQWLLNGETVSTNSEYTFEATDNITLVAEFIDAEAPTYTVTLSVSEEMQGSTTGSGDYKAGRTVTITATASDGYKFIGWRIPGSTSYDTTENPHSFVITGNVELIAVFEAKPIYTVATTANPVGYGTVTGGGQFIENTACTVTASANEGYTFRGWSGIYDSQQDYIETNPYTFTVTSNRNVEGTFGILRHITTSVNNSAWGSVTADGSAWAGDPVTIRWTANDGYTFDKLEINGSEATTTSTTRYTLIITETMPDPITVKVYFKPIQTFENVFVLSSNVCTVGSNLGLTLLDFSVDYVYKIYWYDNIENKHLITIDIDKANLEIPIGSDIESTMSDRMQDIKTIYIERYIDDYLSATQEEQVTVLIPSTMGPTVSFGITTLGNLFSNKPVAGKSTFSIPVTVDINKPNGYNSATITSYTAEVTKGQLDDTSLSRTIEKVESGTFAVSEADYEFALNVTVTDSRGNTLTPSTTATTVYGYKEPNLELTELYKCTATGEESEETSENKSYYIAFTIDYSSIGETNGISTSNIKVTIDDNEYDVTLTDGVYHAIIGNDELSPTIDYTITVVYSDNFMIAQGIQASVWTYETYERLPLSLLHRQNGRVVGAAFGARATISNAVQMGLDTVFSKNTNLYGAIENENVEYTLVTKPAYDVLDRGGINSVAISNADIEANSYANNQRVMDSTTWKAMKAHDEHTLYYLTDTTGLK